MLDKRFEDTSGNVGQEIWRYEWECWAGNLKIQVGMLGRRFEDTSGNVGQEIWRYEWECWAGDLNIRVGMLGRRFEYTSGNVGQEIWRYEWECWAGDLKVLKEFSGFLVQRLCVGEQVAAVKASSLSFGWLYPFLMFHYTSCDETILGPFDPEDVCFSETWNCEYPLVKLWCHKDEDQCLCVTLWKPSTFDRNKYSLFKFWISWYWVNIKIMVCWHVTPWI
jgi:hypothetical protein